MAVADLTKAHGALVEAATTLLEDGAVSVAAIDQLTAAKRSFDAACSAAVHMLVFPPSVVAIFTLPLDRAHKYSRWAQRYGIPNKDRSSRDPDPQL